MLKLQIISAIRDTIVEYLKTNNIPGFIGGSMRFGYSTLNSDVDIYVYIEGSKMNFAQYLMRNGFGVSAIEGYGNVPYSFGDLVHIIIIQNKSEFDTLANEHYLLEEFLEEHPYLRQVAVSMQNNFCDGKTIYRTLQHYRMNYVPE